MASPSLEGADVHSADTELKEAKRLLGAADPEGALPILQRLIEQDIEPVPARFLLAMVAWRVGRLDWAVGLMQDCHARRPMDGAVAEALASLYAQAGNLHESLFMGKLATALKGKSALSEFVPPGFPSFGQAFLEINEAPKLAEGEAQLAGGDLAAAVESARQHAALNPKSSAARAFYAMTLLRAGASAAAVEALRPAENNRDFEPACASLYARALTRVGDFDAARQWHEYATGTAPDDAAYAAARIADALWLEARATERVAASEAWARRHCSPLRRSPVSKSERLTVGYLVAGLADPLDAAAVSAVARAHDRQHVKAVGYGIGAQSWHENLAFQGTFDIWQDISSLDASALALYFERDGLDVIVDASGFNYPLGLFALAQAKAVLRVAWLNDPASAVAACHDAQIQPADAKSGPVGAWPIGGGYPVPGVRQVTPIRSEGALQFGADASMAQLDQRTVALWSSLLSGLPAAKLLLRARDMAHGANIDRLVVRFGRDLAARIDVVNVEQMEEFYAKVDLALAPMKGVSPRAAAEALACGVPILALAEPGSGNVYADLLRGAGLGRLLVAADEAAFTDLAMRLAGAEELRRRVASEISRRLSSGICGAGQFAHALEAQAEAALGSVKALAS